MNTLLKKDELVSGAIDFAQRKQLTQHHTGAHVVNLACQKILGRHVWQAGAAKTLEKARLDITHYEQISEKQMKEIENYCNKIIKDSFPVKKELLPREIAEEKYGMRIYQGGFVPGRELRIVSIADLDHEACGGTHVNNTIEIENIKILNTSRIQDGVIRINYTCGNASKQTASDSTALIEQLAKLLGVKKNAVPARAAELFAKWKKAKKSAKSGEKIDTILSETKELNLSDDDLVKETAKIFSTQPEHIVKTARRFLEEIESAKKGK
jgi:alanyl-tRNA synthetase